MKTLRMKLPDGLRGWLENEPKRAGRQMGKIGKSAKSATRVLRISRIPLK